MAELKEIQIRCRGAGTLAHHLMTPSQGALKTLTDVNANRLMNEMLEDGFIEPISVWEDPETSNIFILNGHQRHEVLRRMKDDGYVIPEIPVNYVEAVSIQDAKKKLLALASQYGSVSSQGLKSIIDELGIRADQVGEFYSFPEIDISSILSGVESSVIIGADFEANSLLSDTAASDARKLKRETTEPIPGQDDIPDKVAARTKAGNIYTLGRHRLMCGDSTNKVHVGRLMNGVKADMVFTDPPYGVDYDGGTTKREKIKGDHDESIYAKVLPVLVEFSMDHAAFFVWYAQSFSAAVSAAVSAAGLVERKCIIWNKNMAQFGALSAQYKDKYEPVLYCFKKGHIPQWYGPTNEVSVWDVARASVNEFHPTQKPVELCERALNNHTLEDQNVLDLFGGSGSTLIACEKKNRISFSMELDPSYCDVIVARWEVFTGQKAELLKPIRRAKGDPVDI